MSQQFKGILKKASSSFAIQLVGMIAGYVFGILVSRMYGAESFGLLSLAMSLLNILTITSVLGFDRASVKIIAQLRANHQVHLIRKYFTKVVLFISLSSIMVAILLFFSAETLLTHWYKKPQYIEILPYFAPAVWGLSIMIVSSEALRGLKKIKSYTFFRLALMQLLSILFVLILGQWFSLNKPVLLSYVLATLVAGMVAWLYARNKIQKQSMDYPMNTLEDDETVSKVKLNSKVIEVETKLDWKPLLKLAVPLALASSMGVIMSQVSIQLLGRYVSNVDIGVYAAAVKISMLSAIALKAVNSITTPQFAEAHATQNQNLLRSTAKIATTLSFVVSMPVVLFCMVVPEFILGFYGDEFVVGARVLQVLALGRFIAAAAGPTVNILQMTGHEKLFQNILLLALVLLICLSLWWIPQYGIIGAAWASVIAISFNNLLCLWVIKQKLGFWNFPMMLTMKKLRAFRSFK